jgi:indole-3-glycerol phosphate synthase
MMKFSSLLLLACPLLANAFVVQSPPRHHHSPSALHAIGVLAKKAKEAELRKYVSEGVEDSVMEQYKRLKVNLNSVDLSAPQSPGPLQQELTKRKGTITVIAEYKRKNDQCETGYIKDMYDPEILSPSFREYGASGIAVMADERMGGCTYEDLAAFAEEQRRAQSQVPGPVTVINNDLIIDELQIARTAACGAQAVVLTCSILTGDDLTTLLKAAKALDLEAIAAVSTKEEAQTAVDQGARIVLVVNIEGIDDKVAVIQDLVIPEGQAVCTIANIVTRNDKGLAEIEEAWAIRDKGFNCAWVGDALYKSGLETETPGVIIKSMKSKSSLKWASPKASHGRGEGAREYLGDILM